MWFRRSVLAAAVIAPLAFGSVVSAQERGRGNGNPAVTQQAGDNGQAVGRPTWLPRGIARLFGLGRDLPPGIERTRQVPAAEPAVTPEPEPEPPAPQPEPQPEPPAPQPEPEPEPEPVCDVTLVYVAGMPMLQDCHGNLVPVFGFPG